MCEKAIFDMYKSLAKMPMNELSFSDLMLLTGHAKCCGVQLKQQEIKNTVKSIDKDF